MNASLARAYSSVGRAPVLHTGGHRFESCCAQRSKEMHNAGVVQLVRAPACHAGSCGFKPRLPRHFNKITRFHSNFIHLLLCCICFLSFLACTSRNMDDLREEGEGIINALNAELKQIRSRDDLSSHVNQLQLLFNLLVTVIIEMESYKDAHPDAVTSLQNRKEPLASDQLRIELNRILHMEGGREVIEKIQEESLNRLDAYIHSYTPPS